MVGFAKDYVLTGNGTQSALKNYNTTDIKTASVIAVENLAKPSVRELIEDFAETAAKNIQKLANGAENETVRLNANKDILDRAGHVAVTKTETKTLTVTINETPQVIAEAKELLKQRLLNGE